jgi:hypothetical protein
MSESDSQRIVEHIIQSAANPMIVTDAGIEVTQKVGELAAQEELEWVLLASGVVRLLYGRPNLAQIVPHSLPR